MLTKYLEIQSQNCKMLTQNCSIAYKLRIAKKKNSPNFEIYTQIAR